MDENILVLRDVCKTFPGVKALDHVDFDVKKGEVLALAGENGAGKSTLMKILSGSYTRDCGTIEFCGKPAEIHNPRDAERLGLSIIYQELNVLQGLSVAENIFIGRQPKKKNGLVDWAKMNKDAEELFQQLHIEMDVRRKVLGMSIAQQQMVEIARSVSFRSKLVIMDEPTSSLTDRETQLLFDIIRNLKSNGVSVIFITHRLDEIFTIADRITVLRDGHTVGTRNVSETTKAELIALMIGREMTKQFPPRDVKIGQELLRVENISDGKKVKGVSFSVVHGEVLGFAGLVGAGRTETMRMIFGADKRTSGDIYLNGQKIEIRSPQDSVKHKIAFVTENRKTEGLLLNKSVYLNIVMVALNKIKKGGLINHKLELQYSQQYIKELHIATPDENKRVIFLSGGNQQKIVVAKWLMSDSEVIILDEPTRGIDVGAKREIYELINDLARAGKAVIVISSDMEEVLGISDRIAVMHEGRIAGMVEKKDFSQQIISEYAIGGAKL